MEAPKVLGDARFSDLMLEMGLLVAAVAARGFTMAALPRNGSGKLEVPNSSERRLAGTGLWRVSARSEGRLANAEP